MARLEDLTRGAQVQGILPDGLVTVVDVQWHGAVAIELTYKDTTGRLGNELLFRDHEPTFEVVAAGRLWNLDADGALLRLVSEAYRIHLAYLFDPRLAVHTSLVGVVRTAAARGLLPPKTCAHTLRHTFARTYLEEYPGDVVGLATLLGQASLDTTRLYSQPTIEQLGSRVEGLRQNAYSG